MSGSSIIKPLVFVLAGLPGAVLAHPGHGGGSASQHDWEHALWLGAAATGVAWAVWVYRQYRNREG
ncbi:MAG: hypothetical protein RLP45_12635 [Haliea sp.]|uniref:hypothetical protein n=1 Tax=Marinobacter salarius TaxID=1420917 RepID=UPI0032EC5B32